MIGALKYLKNPWVLLGIVIVIFLVYRKFFGGGSLINIFNPVSLPTHGPSGEPLTTTQSEAVRELAMRLHTDMDGATITNFQRDVEAWRQFMSLPDNLFRAVYNDFGNLYFREGEGTLREWIENEWTWVDTAGVASRSQILNRMATLNLQ
jgi:hypothetical protein